MTKRSTKWMLSMMEHYSMSEAEVRQMMGDRQKLSLEKRRLKGTPHRGGFSNKELASQAGKKGMAVRWGATSTKLNQD